MLNFDWDAVLFPVIATVPMEGTFLAIRDTAYAVGPALDTTKVFDEHNSTCTS